MALKALAVRRLVPATWKLVTPLDRHSSMAASARSASGMGRARASAAATRAAALSRRAPVGLPSESLTMVPPGGSGVWASKPLSSIAH